MELQRTRYGYTVRIDAGEEIVDSLTRFAASEGVRAGAISGIGSVSDPELGYFVGATRDYTRRVFPGDWELASLTGNISELEGRPFPHCHAMIGGADFAAFGGHLFRGVVAVTCEVQVTTDAGVLRRVSRPELGFNPLDPGGMR